MAMLRCTIAFASFLFLPLASGNALAQSGVGASSDPAPAAGATGRGVRILPPEPVNAPTVADKQQVQPEPSRATPEPPAAQPGGLSPVAPPATLPVLTACDRPVATPALRFSEQAQFDRLLRKKLRTGRAVTVDMDTPYPADREAPLPLGAWLNEIKQSGGSVSVAPYCQKGRGLGGFFAKLFGGGPARPYKAARRYDAVLHVDAVDQVVTQVEFTPRKVGQ